jgi:serine/threonine protein kinase
MTDNPANSDSRAAPEPILLDWPTIPGYEILEIIGRGGMGVVYRARQTSLKRVVALKLIRDSALASAQDRGRFRIEAEAVARMSHPNIVQVYDVGEHQGRPYFAMELVEGRSLEQHFAGQAVPALEAARLVRTLARAIHHAHTRQIVHRDLKPANILLVGGGVVSGKWSGASSTPTTHHSLLTPKITDFGLAKRLDSESTGWTQEGAVLGTANYMAPEQAAGRSQEVGPAADIHALGAILYELLTGESAFQGDSWTETLQQVMYDDPKPPTRIRSELPCDLETICLKCLEKQPVRRYASASELADDLDRFLEGKTVIAVPLTQMERMARLAIRDGYEILNEIGRGPRSIVYRAQSGPLHQPMALKVFQNGICSRGEWEAGVRRGADLWTALSHPQIVPIQRAGWWDGSPFLAMEYVQQGSLADRLTGQPFSIPQALQLVEQVAEIVSYLHRQGVVHGNLKPSNLLLAADGIPRIVDLHTTGGLFHGSLAQVQNDAANETIGNLAGLGYLAPELVQDPTVELRPHADIYGLGLILYELLTGRPIFTGATAHEILEQIRSQDPIPPSQLNSKVTPRLEWVCLRSLRKNPWRRFYRVYDLMKRLRDLQENPEER